MSSMANIWARIWIGKARLFGTGVRGLNQPLGKEVTIRIISAPGGMTVEQEDGVDGVGVPRWAKTEPRLYTQDSLLAALVNAAGTDALPPPPTPKE